MSRVQQLRAQGFDESYNIPFERAWKVRCSQCEACTVNGIPCHERGCPNQVRDEDES
jgi:hypothetical protein